mmetsp:Transcript_18664/g.51205  ORF Transcript_18664/g.51205 Transcript_18664/m.51205 type:complete len:205 (+) Transcript_18664:956-1570(+)
MALHRRFDHRPAPPIQSLPRRQLRAWDATWNLKPPPVTPLQRRSRGRALARTSGPRERQRRQAARLRSTAPCGRAFVAEQAGSHRTWISRLLLPPARRRGRTRGQQARSFQRTPRRRRCRTTTSQRCWCARRQGRRSSQARKEKHASRPRRCLRGLPLRRELVRVRTRGGGQLIFIGRSVARVMRASKKLRAIPPRAAWSGPRL